MWDQYDWNSNEDLSLPSPSIDRPYIGDRSLHPSTSRHGQRRTSSTSSFPTFRSKIKALLSGDRSQPSGPEDSRPSNLQHSIASQRMLDIANSMDPPPYSEREFDTSPLGHSGYNFASTAPSDMRANIQTSGDQSCQNHLSESQHSRHKRNSMLQKVVRGVSRGKGADARPMSFHADTATTQRLHGMVLLRTERQRPQSFLSNPHTRQPTGSRMSFELNSPSIRHTLRHD